MCRHTLKNVVGLYMKLEDKDSSRLPQPLELLTLSPVYFQRRLDRDMIPGQAMTLFERAADFYRALYK